MRWRSGVSCIKCAEVGEVQQDEACTLVTGESFSNLPGLPEVLVCGVMTWLMSKWLCTSAAVAGFRSKVFVGGYHQLSGN